ncbi:5'-nucleotidase C-terminal domain-containing protein [Lewinella sp. IMCC34191]|uniref:5'-nucleotidase C-terminal domain-containing protein n=1 Tax=Lewinella sp. IMCC34191 TaxID=2259172 RepID=UPI001300A56B|nr:5'-nucleotidase C-terminal domain-containing protein [Lewinella sp. IMCC34191]
MIQYLSTGLTVLSFCLLLAGCQRPLGPAAIQPQFYAITAAIEPDSTEGVATRVAGIIDPYADQLSEAMNRVIGEVALPLVKAQPESSLGNWTADLLLTAARDLFPDYDIAFAVQNYGGLRIAQIGSGPMRVNDIYELMPFDNELVLVEVTGREMTDFVKHTLTDGGWPVSEGLVAIRSRDGMDIRVQGKEVDDEATYYLAVPDYVANGGNDAAMLLDKRQIGSGKMIRDLLIEYAGKTQGPISVESDGSRIKIMD